MSTIMVHNKVGKAVYHTCVTTKDRGDNAGKVHTMQPPGVDGPLWLSR